MDIERRDSVVSVSSARSETSKVSMDVDPSDNSHVFPADTETSVCVNVEKIQNILQEIARRIQDDQISVSDKAELHAMLLFAKKLSRDVYFRSDKLMHERQDLLKEVEQVFLEKKSLLYQKNQLLKEIEQFDVINDDSEALSLVPLEELQQIDKFRHISNETSEHRIRIERLQHELVERKALKKRITELKAQIRTARSETSSRYQTLQGLKSKLDSVFEAAKPLRSEFGLPETLEIPSSSIYSLPFPLYNLYCHGTASKSVFKESWDLTVVSGMKGPSLLVTIPHESETISIQFNFHENVNLVFVQALSGLSQKDLFSIIPHDTGVYSSEELLRFLESKGESADGFPFRWAQTICGIHFPLESDQNSSHESKQELATLSEILSKALATFQQKAPVRQELSGLVETLSSSSGHVFQKHLEISGRMSYNVTRCRIKGFRACSSDEFEVRESIKGFCKGPREDSLLERQLADYYQFTIITVKKAVNCRNVNVVVKIPRNYPLEYPEFFIDPFVPHVIQGNEQFLSKYALEHSLRNIRERSPLVYSDALKQIQDHVNLLPKSLSSEKDILMNQLLYLEILYDIHLSCHLSSLKGAQKTMQGCLQPFKGRDQREPLHRQTPFAPLNARSFTLKDIQ